MTTEMTSENIHALLREGLRPQIAPRTYKFPVTLANDAEVFINVRLLPEREIDDAKIEASRYCVKRKVDLNVDPEFFDREVQRQIVWRAIVKVLEVAENGSPLRLFATDDDVRDLPSTVVEALWRLYLEHQDRATPMVSVDAAGIDALVKSIRVNGADAVSVLEHASLVRLVIALAQERAAS